MIAQRRAAGNSATSIAAEFGLTATRIKEIADATDRYERGEAILRFEPTSLEGLALVGAISILAKVSLRARGIQRLEDLRGLSMRDLLRMPNIGRRVAATLFELCGPGQ